MVRTRIAPSPTGEDLHIGNLYTGLINWVMARKYEGKFIIRIEDTDRTRFVEGATEKILDSLKKFHIFYDEGPDIGGPYAPYYQSQRLSIYHEYAQKLIDSGHAEFAYYPKEGAGKKKDYTQAIESSESKDESGQSSPKSIEEMITRGDWVVRQIIPKNEKVIVHDLIRGDIEFDTNELSKQVLIKSDGYPTYHLGVVVDDYLMKISHIIRAEEWISSTPKHVLLYKAFGWELPIFAHLPILRNPDRSKLSKRKNPVWVSWYIDEGYLPQAVVNFLALLGWSHPEEKEIFSVDEFTAAFELKDIKPIGPVFDLTKLTWMNGIYIREVLSHEELQNALYVYDPTLKEIDGILLKKLIEVAKTRIKTLKEFTLMIAPFLHPLERKLDKDQKEILDAIALELRQLSVWHQDSIASVILEKFIKTKRVSFKDLYTMLINTDKGLPLADTFAAIGKEKTLALFHE